MHQTQPSLFGRVGALLAGLALSGAVALSANAVAAEPAAQPQVQIKTTMGDIVVELDREKAPKSVDNFLAYVKSGYYKGTIFHRVIDGFMIQGGGYDEKLKSKPTRKNVPSESQNGLSNDAYTIAMARMDDPNSANSQFFINVADNQALNFPGRDGVGYTVFGKVIDGRETVDKIKGVLVDDKGIFQNIPVTPIIVKSATILKTPIQPKNVE
ncbi:peptidylprolyl isomerase [Duganella phyllosphaerae]|uniref:Peptidyl-prolyl cis-trans isomerase n=1 Tax=Duganella phyllosphaerae TaxID=762836 RepID=A0A1E7WCZ0_9BURK|nr:peptidylprolyl isomerase [Duganella phyllosphaerae]OEZ95637.1 peptidyl-prolyl cis-trans isomerase cyp18 [Duganella phyllosphaerae]